MPGLSFAAYLGRTLTNNAKLFFAFHLFGALVGSPQLTDGPSMLPLLNVRGDCLWISTLHRRGKGVKVGDLVSLMHPLVPGAGASKRVLGMPGDYVMRDSRGSGSDMMIQVGFGPVFSRKRYAYFPMPLPIHI